MPVLTDLASARVKAGVTQLFGQTLTRPTILLTDGLNTTYCVDVNITERDASGAISQYINEKKKPKEKDGIVTNEMNYLWGLVGNEDWKLDDSLPGHVDTTLHNVPLSRNNADLIYADVGSPVIVDRSESGMWQVIGFSLEQPGTHKLYPVDLGDMTIGTIMDLTISTRLLTLAEIGTLRPFGDLPFGASAIYRGEQLLSLV